MQLGTVLLPVLSQWFEWYACHVTQVAVARKLAELAARPRIQIPASQRESGLARVDRWMAENTKNSYGMHLAQIASCCIVLAAVVQCFIRSAQQIPVVFYAKMLPTSVHT